jgi:hypothetical protein
MRGRGQRNISACSFSRQRHFCVMCCLIRRFTFSLLRKLSSTSSDGVRSGNLNVQLPLVVLFGGDACVAFLEIWCFKSLHYADTVLSMYRLWRKWPSRWGWARLGRWLGFSLSMIVWNGMVS